VESIYVALGHHEWIESTVESSEPSWHRLDDVSRRCLISVASFTAFAEMFMVERLLTLVVDTLKSFGPGPKKTFEGMLNSKVENSFMERVSIMEAWFGMDLRSWSAWNEWNGFLEARNAWAHGQGRLTRQQERRNAGRYVTAAGMTLDDGVIRCNAETARRAARCAVSLVDLLDGSLLGVAGR
jgi:hypothetical protein